MKDSADYISLPVGILQMGIGEGRDGLLSRKGRMWLYYLSRGTQEPHLTPLEDLCAILGVPDSLGMVRKLRSQLVAEGFLKKVYVKGRGWGYTGICRNMNPEGWEALLASYEVEPEPERVEIVPCWPHVFLPSSVHVEENQDLTLTEWWGSLGHFIEHRSFTWVMDLQKPKTRSFWMREIRDSIQKREAKNLLGRKLVGDPDTQVQTVLLGLARHVVAKKTGWVPSSPVAYLRGMIHRLGIPSENLPLPDEEDVEDDMGILHEMGIPTLADLTREVDDEHRNRSHDIC